MKLAYIAIFGTAGVISRYLLGIIVARYWASPFPIGTFLINILGCFCIGLVYVIGAERGLLSPDLRLGVIVGFLGGFTTFAACALELTRLIEESRYGVAAAYFCLSPVLGLIAALVGLYVARIFWQGGSA